MTQNNILKNDIVSIFNKSSSSRMMVSNRFSVVSKFAQPRTHSLCIIFCRACRSKETNSNFKYLTKITKHFESSYDVSNFLKINNKINFLFENSQGSKEQSQNELYSNFKFLGGNSREENPLCKSEITEVLHPNRKKFKFPKRFSTILENVK
jgi:hypothetical protein